MLFHIQRRLVVSGGKELEMLGDVPDEEEEAIEEDDEMTTGLLQQAPLFGSSSKMAPSGVKLAVTVLVRQRSQI